MTVLGLISCVPERNQQPTEIIAPSTPTVISNNQMPERKILWDFSLSQDETKMAVFTSEGVFIHDLKSGKKQAVEIFQDYHYSYRGGAVALSPNGNKILISGRSFDQPITIWDLATRKQVAIFSDIPKGYWVKEIEFAPNGKKVVVRISKISCESEYDKFLLFDVDGNNEWANSDLFALDRECIIFPPITSRFTHDDKLFVFNASPPTIIFNANTGENISTELNNTEQIKIYYDISSDGKTVAISDLHGNSTLVNIETGESLDVIQGKVLLLNDEKKFLVNDKENQWNLRENGENKCSYDGLRFNIYPGEFELIKNGNFLAAYNSPEQELQVWDISSCIIIYSLPFN